MSKSTIMRFRTGALLLVFALLICPITTNAAIQVPQTGLLGHWAFEEGSGTSTADESNNSNDGTLLNSPSWIAGYSGNALSFTNNGLAGSRNTVQLPANLQGAGFPPVGTVAFWIRGNFSAQGARTVIDRNENRDHMYIRTNDASSGLQLALQNSAGTNVISQGVPITSNTWTHIAFEWDARNDVARMYKNGTRIYTSTNVSPTWAPTQQYFNVASTTDSFIGDLDELVLYERTLSDAEIAAIYSNSAPPEADITAPTTPVLLAAGFNPTQVVLAWEPSTDAIGVDGYSLYRNGTKITNLASTTLTYIDTGLATSTSYSYSLYAYDEGGNQSQAGAASATTLGAPLRLESDFESYPLGADGISGFVTDGPRSNSVVITDELSRSGEKSAKFTMHYEDWDNSESDSKRAELKLNGTDPNFNFAIGDTHWIGLSQYIPDDWIDDYANNNDILWQFHGAEGGHGSGASPPISLRVLGSEMMITRSDGVDNDIPIGDAFPIQKGTWGDWVFRVKFDFTDGFIQAWYNGVEVANYTGQTIYVNDAATTQSGPYFKFGNYRSRWAINPTLTTTRVLYADDYRVGSAASTCNDVRPAGANACGLDDLTPPTVSLSSPASGTVSNGASTTITASASDNGILEGVSFYANGELIGSEDTYAPYEIEWVVPDEGAQSLVAVARDRAGNLATSSEIRLGEEPSQGGGSGGGSSSRSGRTRTVGNEETVTGTEAPAALNSSVATRLILDNRHLFEEAQRLGIQIPSYIRSMLGMSQGGFVFERDLTLGSEGQDVLELQKLLNRLGYTLAETGPGSPGLETPYFGLFTQSALARMQAASGIVPAVGYFGPITRAFLKTLQ